jgi:hypothetical protein
MTKFNTLTNPEIVKNFNDRILNYKSKMRIAEIKEIKQYIIETFTSYLRKIPMTKQEIIKDKVCNYIEQTFINTELLKSLANYENNSGDALGKKFENYVLDTIKPILNQNGFEIISNTEFVFDYETLEQVWEYNGKCRVEDFIKINKLQLACEKLGLDYQDHNSDDKIEDFDELLKIAPYIFTAIVIKGFFRASKRIPNIQHIGATYEPIPKQQDVSVTAQALTARFCNTYEYSGDHLDINLRPLHYCDKEAIIKYLEWFNNDCDFSISKYKSQRISSNGKGKVSSKPTKVDSTIVKGLNNSNSNSNSNSNDNSDTNINDNDNDIIITNPVIIKRNSYEEIIQYFKDNLKEIFPGSLGPRKPAGPDSNGFYIDANTKTILSRIELYDKRNDWLNTQKTPYRLRICYADQKDPSTIRWWLMYKDPKNENNEK